MKKTPEEQRAYNAKRHREYMRKYRKTPKFIAYRRAYDKARPRKDRAPDARRFRAKVRREVISGYGGRCICCGENELTFLTIDHVVPIRKGYHKGRENQHALYLRLRREKFPTGYQVLCFNCNHAKGTGAECPHRKIFERHFVLLRGTK